jgi:cell volume regulation protein A
VFVALGLTIHLTGLSRSVWLDGIVLAAFLALVARPLVVGTLLLPTHLRTGERLFVMWGGLKGAVPIFLAAFAILAGVTDAERLYSIVFVVVALSVLIQGSTIPLAASLAGVPMRLVRHEPLRRAGQYE